MINLINGLIGAAMGVLSAFRDHDDPDEGIFKKCFGTFLETYTEFMGDALQTFIRDVKYRRDKNVALKEAIKILRKKNIDEATYRGILDDIKNATTESSPRIETLIGKIKERVSKLFVKEEKRDARILCDIYDEILFYFDYSEYLCEVSPQRYAQLDEETRKAFDTLLQQTIEAYVRSVFNRSLEDNEKLQATVIVTSLKNFLTDERFIGQFSKGIKKELGERLTNEIGDHIIEKLLTYCSVSNGGKLELKEIALSRYAPKYILSECPICGYYGERIYTNEKNATTYCAACGRRYSVEQYSEPELFAKMDQMFESNNSALEALRELLKMYQQEGQTSAQEILNKIIDLGDTVIESNAERSAEELAQFEELRSELKKGLEGCVAQQHLESLLHAQEDNFADLKESLMKQAASADRFNPAMLGMMKETIDQLVKVSQKADKQSADVQSILDSLKGINDQNRSYYERLSQKTEDIGAQVNQILEYERKVFPEMNEQMSTLLEYAQKAVTKESVEEMTSALGGDVKKAIADAGRTLSAITESSMAQIMSQIDSINAKGLSSEGLSRMIKDGGTHLSGQINGMQRILREHTENSKENFRIIISMLEDQRVSLMASVGLQMGQEEFKKIYQGKIPSMYLYDEGLGGAFACPYCGATEPRTLNEDQYCRCNVCGNKFLGVNPSISGLKIPKGEDIWTFLHKNFGKPRDDVLYATDERVKKWRAAHTATMTVRSSKKAVDFFDSFKIEFPSAWPQDGLLILPELAIRGNAAIKCTTINQLTVFDTETASKIKTLIFSDDSSVAFIGMVRSGNSNKSIKSDPFADFPNISTVVICGKNKKIELGDSALENFRKNLGWGNKLYGVNAEDRKNFWEYKNGEKT